MLLACLLLSALPSSDELVEAAVGEDWLLARVVSVAACLSSLSAALGGGGGPAGGAVVPLDPAGAVAGDDVAGEVEGVDVAVVAPAQQGTVSHCSLV